MSEHNDAPSIKDVLVGVADAFAGASTVACIIAGHRAGFYSAMAHGNPMTSGELAEAATTNERMTREWLDQQAAAQLLMYDEPTDSYSLPATVATVLADPDSPFWLAGGLVAVQALFLDLDRGIDAMKGDGGFGWGEHHPYLFEGTQEIFRPAYDHQLVQHWLPQRSQGTTDLEAGIMVADMGCGTGYSTITLARAFPDSTFVGFDLHQPSIDQARQHAADAGLTNVSFELAAADAISGPFDLICFFDCLHDMGDPVGIASHAISQLSQGGSIVLVEPFAMQTRTENHYPRASLRYAMSLFCCVPCSLAQPGARGMGSQAGEAGMRAVFAEAGLDNFTRIAESPNHIVYEARPA
jgi:SAM-dependent methyltransferase